MVGEVSTMATDVGAADGAGEWKHRFTIISILGLNWSFSFMTTYIIIVGLYRKYGTLTCIE